jgi:salicylate hydroxylase
MFCGSVLVVGGGIAGLASAIALRKVGMRVDVFERTPELREVGAGLGFFDLAAMRRMD